MTSLDGMPGLRAGEPDDPPAVTLARVRIGPGGRLGSVRVADGRIVAVVTEDGRADVTEDAGGSSAGDAAGDAAADVVVDLGGRTVLPGLWDAHVHMAQWAGNRHRLGRRCGARSATPTGRGRNARRGRGREAGATRARKPQGAKAPRTRKRLRPGNRAGPEATRARKQRGPGSGADPGTETAQAGAGGVGRWRGGVIGVPGWRSGQGMSRRRPAGSRCAGRRPSSAAGRRAFAVEGR